MTKNNIWYKLIDAEKLRKELERDRDTNKINAPKVRMTNADLISRRKAIDLFLAEGMVTAAVYVERMPSAQPERKKGEWVRNFDGNEWYWFCSNCKEEWYEEDLLMGGNDFPNFCPNCGADMRGEAND